MLRIVDSAYRQMIGHALDGLPDEACGRLVGRPAVGKVERFVACRNADASARTYSIAADCWAAADRETAASGLDVFGVMHSHTHTEAYPSPTDVEKADNP